MGGLVLLSRRVRREDSLRGELCAHISSRRRAKRWRPNSITDLHANVAERASCLFFGGPAHQDRTRADRPAERIFYLMRANAGLDCPDGYYSTTVVCLVPKL